METSTGRPDPQQESALDTSTPHAARIWNYWIGGRDNFAIDREVGDKVREVFPAVVDVARAARAFLVRSVRYLAKEHGIRQFLDIGSGLPTADNTHEVAQAVAPECRIVYVDYDPLVRVHARALLASSPDGACAYVEADARDPDKILREAADTLDFGKPVALMMLGVLGHVADYDQARSIVTRLLETVVPGSYLVINDGTISEARERAEAATVSSGVTYTSRTPEQIAHYFDGLELVEPGVVSTPLWRPDPSGEPPAGLDEYCGVGRKP
jgi:O-methyltransferase involved in polyketide biosynthesis